MPTVKILNPAYGEGWTNRNRATEYVNQGRAVWCKRPDGTLAIRFLSDHPLDAKVRASEPSQLWDGIDRRKMPATLKEQAEVPLIRIRKRAVHQRPSIDSRGHRLNPVKSFTRKVGAGANNFGSFVETDDYQGGSKSL